MNTQKKLQLGAIALCFFTLTACQNKVQGNANKTNSTKAKQEEQLEKIKMTGQDIETDKKMGNDMLTKDLNIVFVWQPTCPPCQAEGKALEMIYKDFKDVNIIGLGVAEKEQDVEKAIKEWGMTFKNYYVKVTDIGKISENIKSTPTMLVLDKNGKEIQSKVVGSSSNGENIEALSIELKDKIQGVIDEQK